MLNNIQREYIGKNKHRMTPAEIARRLEIKPSLVRQALKGQIGESDQKTVVAAFPQRISARILIFSLIVLMGLIIIGYYPSIHNRYAFDDISTIEDNTFI